MSEFRVPVHAVDVELEIPGRFFVRDVWEVEEESTAEQCDALEGACERGRRVQPPSQRPSVRPQVRTSSPTCPTSAPLPLPPPPLNFCE
jgi:hypothetical protein